MSHEESMSMSDESQDEPMSVGQPDQESMSMGQPDQESMSMGQSSAAQPGRPPWLPWPVFPFKSRFAGIGGKQIHYIDEGSGPALLLVSAGQWSFMFRDLIVRLRGRFRCLTLDFPGCGLTRCPRP